jgi:hypothetical protein
MAATMAAAPAMPIQAAENSAIDDREFEPAAEMTRTDAGLHADQAGRHVGKPCSTWPRDHFCRSAILSHGLLLSFGASSQLTC